MSQPAPTLDSMTHTPTLAHASIDTRREGCLFCRDADGDFRAEEHVFPESLGNQDLVLPKGVVCDRCNNEVLAGLDQALCDFLPIKMRRTMLGIPSKAGKVPTTRLMSGTVEQIEPGSLRMNAHGRKPLIWETGRDEHGVQLRFEGSGGRRLTPRYGSELARALLKAAMECAWLDHRGTMFEERFDHCRTAVLGTPFDGFVAIGKQVVPEHEQVSLTYDFRTDTKGGSVIWVVAAVYGVTLATASKPGDSPASLPKDKVDVIPFRASDLA